MTNEEAIEILREERDWAQQLAYVNNALNLAIEALEKQMPRKPKIIDYARPYYDRGGAIIDGEMYVKCHCPVCEILLFDVEYTCFEDFKETDEFCMSCGQALDWSDTE